MPLLPEPSDDVTPVILHSVWPAAFAAVSQLPAVPHPSLQLLQLLQPQSVEILMPETVR